MKTLLTLSFENHSVEIDLAAGTYEATRYDDAPEGAELTASELATIQAELDKGTPAPERWNPITNEERRFWATDDGKDGKGQIA